MSGPTALERVESALLAHGSRGKAGSWTCPAHPDSNPSLSVKQGDKGVKVFCHAGCSPSDVTEALGLKMADLFDQPKERSNGSDREKVAEYIYKNADSTPYMKVTRWRSPDGKKTFTQSHWEEGRWVSGLKGWPPILYRLPELLEGIAEGRRIFIAEGEKDVDALVRAGELATCNPMGAGKWRPSYGQALKGAASVVIVADRDQPGYRHAKEVRFNLQDKVGEVVVVQARVGKDAADHLGAGLPVSDLEVITDELDQLACSSDSEEQAAGEEIDGGDQHPEDDGDQHAELALLRGELIAGNAILNIPKPTPLVEGILDLDSVGVIYGPPSSSKSFVALDIAACVASGLPWQGRATRQGPGLYLAGEGVGGLGIRTAAWQEYYGGNIDQLVWLPRAVNLLEARWLTALVALVAEMRPVLVIVDTVARSMAGSEENSAKDMGRLVDAADQLRRAAGSCVVLVHHTGKDEGRGMRGSNSLEGGCETVWEVTRTDTTVTLTNRRQKNHAEDDQPILLQMINVADSAVLVPSNAHPADTLHTNIRGTLQALTDIDTGTGTSTSAWLKSSGAGDRAFYRHLKRLLDLRLIENTGTDKQPRYRPTAEGYDALQ